MKDEGPNAADFITNQAIIVSGSPFPAGGFANPFPWLVNTLFTIRKDSCTLAPPRDEVNYARSEIMAIKVDRNKCTGCEACIGTCPVQVLEMKDGKASYKDEGCIECGACVSVCPVEALTL